MTISTLFLAPAMAFTNGVEPSPGWTMHFTIGFPKFCSLQFGIRIATQEREVSLMTKIAARKWMPFLVLTLSMTAFAAPKKVAKEGANAPAVLWQEPGDIS